MRRKINKTPALRFPEFKGDWEEKRLEEVVSIGSGRDYKHLGKGKVPVYGTGGYMTGVDQWLYEGESVCIGRKGTIDKPIYLSGKFWTVDTLFYTHSFQKIIPKFLLAIFQRINWQRYNEASGVPSLSKSTIKKIDISLPSLPEQQKIADFLSYVDDKITKLAEKKDLLVQYKKGVMQQIFSQQIRFKDEQGQDFPDWEEKRLEEVGEFLKGKGISKSEISEDGAIECIRYGQLYTDYHERIDKIISKTNTPQSELVLSKINDVVVPSSGETKIDIATASTILRDGVAIGGDINIIRTNINGVFLSYYLSNKKKLEIAKLSQGNSVVHLYARQLQSLKIDIPSLPEQQKIADFLTSLDQKIEVIDGQLNQMKSFKKGLLQQMFV